MKVIVFNTENSIINLDAETQMIKYGYLMSDSICIAGQLGANLLFKEEHKNYGIVRKAQFLYDGILSESNQTEGKEEWLKPLLDFIKSAKDFPQIKNPPNDLLLSYNNYRRVFSDWFDANRDIIIEAHHKVGITVMSALLNERKIETKLMNFSMGRYTHSKHEAESNAKLILDFLFPLNKPNEPSILMLPFELSMHVDFTTSKIKEETFENDIIENTDDNNRLISVLTFPELKNLTALQLKALNAELSEPFSVINEKLDVWIGNCKKGKNLTELVKDFEKKVYPLFEQMQKTIDNNLTFLNIKNNPSHTSFKNKILIGIFNFELLWDFYDMFKVLKPETMSFLRKRTTNNKMYPKYFPILHIVPQLVNPENADKIIELERLNDLGNIPSKKYLTID